MTVLFALIFAWFSVRWQIGDMIGELTSPGEEGAAEIAKAAIDLAPSDPRSRWVLGAVLRSDLSGESSAASVAQITDSVRLSPYQPRWWSELGRSLEQAGDNDRAERAFKRAVELAPEYTLPNWQLGNFYLRRSRTDEAVGPLKKAAEHSNLYRGQVFTIAWNYFGSDPQMIEQFSNDRPDVKAGLVTFYSNMDRAEDAIRVWNTLSEEEKGKFTKTAENAAKKLFLQRSYSGAIEFARQSGIDKNVRPGVFTNGDFESGLRDKGQHIFDWTITRPDNKVDIGIDSAVAHGGKRSLRVNFRTLVKPIFVVFDQVVGVRPGSRQRIEFWLRTENLRSGSMPLIEVLSGQDDKVIAVSDPFPVGTNDWRQFAINIEVPKDTDGIRIRTGREACGPECPISGIFWIDDFTIVEAGSK